MNFSLFLKRLCTHFDVWKSFVYFHSHVSLRGLLSIWQWWRLAKHYLFEFLIYVLVFFYRNHWSILRSAFWSAFRSALGGVFIWELLRRLSLLRVWAHIGSPCDSFDVVELVSDCLRWNNILCFLLGFDVIKLCVSGLMRHSLFTLGGTTGGWLCVHVL